MSAFEDRQRPLDGRARGDWYACTRRRRLSLLASSSQASLLPPFLPLGSRQWILGHSSTHTPFTRCVPCILVVVDASHFIFFLPLSLSSSTTTTTTTLDRSTCKINIFNTSVTLTRPICSSPYYYYYSV